MKLNDLFEDGRIVKGVNTTPDVQPGEIQRQSKKFGNKINNAGEPPLLHAKARKNSYVHVLDNLGLTESVQINELFNQIYNWKWDTYSNKNRVAKAVFRTEDNSLVEVFFERLHPDSPNYEVGFKKHGSIKKTDEGDQFKIIGTVIDVIKTFLMDNPETKVLTFSAKREGKAAESPKYKNNRAELYKRLLKRFAEKNGFEIAWDDIGRMTEFIMRRKDLAESYYKPAPEDTLGIKRANMPQVHKDHYPELIDYLNKEGGNHVLKTVDAKTLKAVQGEFSDAGIEKMINNTDDSKGTTRKKPLIVSSDNYIVDGHHRWLAAYNLDQDIPIMQFNIPIRQLLQLIRDFDHTTYKDIYNENMSVVGTERQKEADRKKLQPGTDAWFKHWFSRPYLTRSELTHLKEEVRNLKKRKGVNDEEKNRKRRHDRNNWSDECSSKR